MIFDTFPHYPQVEQSDCGAVCLKTILRYYGKKCDLSYLRNLTQVTRSGITLGDINRAANKLHMKTTGIKCRLANLSDNVELPTILHWEQDHFVVLYKIKNNLYYISDPGFGKLVLNAEEFTNLWLKDMTEGVALEILPTEEFIALELPFEKNKNRQLFQFGKNILAGQKNKIFWLFVLIAISTIISYIFPKTIQNLIDEGFKSRKMSILWAIFGFQMLLFLGQTIANWIQNFIRVHFSMQISIKMLTQLFQKIVKLPVSFFENRLYSDILQKIDEQSRIEQFLTTQLIQTLFSIFLFTGLAIRLFVYNLYFGLGFIALAVFSVFWIFLFYKKRKAIDYYSFKLLSENKNHLLEMITGMVAIKISNSHLSKINNWQVLQNKLYKLKIRSLMLDTWQHSGAGFLKQAFSIFITFLCSVWVIKGILSVGEMISIGYIIGLLSQPIENIITFLSSFQDSQLAYERVQEIYKNEDENLDKKPGNTDLLNKDITFENMSFKYFGGNQPYVLKNINTVIPNGKITAIVGESGSGKTTFLKMLLNFYGTTEGKILLGDQDLYEIDSDWWREQCGVVMQDGYIFSGTIGDNISLQDGKWDEEQLIKACKIACIYDFITYLPLGFNTKIGNSGGDLSGGQKQRILIARAVYKNPDFLFFDEATSSLDAKNEKEIMHNLGELFLGKTVLIIAHRLSTVKNADQIIVLSKGSIIELGNHDELVDLRGEYYSLIKNQLELGN